MAHNEPLSNLAERIAQADRIALQARSAAQAGDHKRASELRAEFDRIHDELKADVLAAGDLADSLDLTIAKSNAAMAGLLLKGD
jgi:hypothetical protein